MTNRLVLPQELTIYTVGELRNSWLSWLSEHADEQHVDASLVDQVDGAGLQLLLSLARSMATHDVTLQLDDPSSTLLAACSTLGLIDPLGLHGALGVAA
jgi:ABC-type transporter Mla MlaB component